MKVDDVVASTFLFWSGVMWPRSRNTGLLKLGALDMDVKSFDLMILSEYFQWNKHVFKRVINDGLVIRTYTQEWRRRNAMTIDNDPFERHYYVICDEDKIERHDGYASIDLFCSMSAAMDDNYESVRVYHNWRCYVMKYGYLGTIVGMENLTTNVRWKSRKLEFVTF